MVLELTPSISEIIPTVTGREAVNFVSIWIISFCRDVSLVFRSASCPLSDDIFQLPPSSSTANYDVRKHWQQALAVATLSVTVPDKNVNLVNMLYFNQIFMCTITIFSSFSSHSASKHCHPLLFLSLFTQEDSLKFLLAFYWWQN